MKTGACYIRVSTDDQTEFSPEAQLKEIKKYAKNHNIILDKDFIFIEKGISGRSVQKRDEFKKMITKAKEKPKPFEVVLVHAYDRFARNVKESRIYKELLRQDLDIELISITEDFGTGKNSFLMEGIKDILNEYYSLNLSDEVKKGMKEKASRGELQASPPFGYKVENNKYVIFDEEANIVKLIFEKYANYEMNILEITKYVNNLGIKTKRGNKFENRSIKYILNNIAYLGMLKWCPNGKINYKNTNYQKDNIIIKKGLHEPLVSEETFNKVQERLTSNIIELKPIAKDNNTWHWSKGLIRCKQCNNTYVKCGKGLRCNGYAKGKCNNHTVLHTNDIESTIIECLKHDFNNSKIKLKTKPITTNNNSEHFILNKRLEKLLNSLERIKKAYQEGIDTLEEYKENKKNVENNINKIKKDISLLKNDDKPQNTLRDEIKYTYEILESKTEKMETKHLAIHGLINIIMYNNNNNELEIYYND